jgi:GNAT superfamily N-acetyltransferase
MTTVPRVSVERDADPADIAAVTTGLRAFNVGIIGDPDEMPVHIFLRDEGNAVVGGLLGHIKWRWLYVSKLWMREELRGRGFGGALMDAAEDIARKHGCIGAHLDTLEYQARPFYEKRGYALFGTLEGFPPGYRQYFLSKRL